MRRLAIPALTGAAYTRLRGRAIVSLAGEHDSLREGTALGIIVATSIWVWLLVVDAVAGQPFQTFAALGGITVFTLVHYLLNVACAWRSCRRSTTPSRNRAWPSPSCLGSSCSRSRSRC